MVSRYLEFEMMRHFVFIFLKEKKKKKSPWNWKKERKRDYESKGDYSFTLAPSTRACTPFDREACE